MELYHKTLIPPTTHSHAYALHLEPIKPKEEHDRPKQLLLATTNSLQLYRHQLASPPSPPASISSHSSQSQNKSSSRKYALRPFHTEQLFSNICSVEAIIYQDDDLRKDIVVVTLSNGKY